MANTDYPWIKPSGMYKQPDFAPIVHLWKTLEVLENEEGYMGYHGGEIYQTWLEAGRFMVSIGLLEPGDLEEYE